MLQRQTAFKVPVGVITNGKPIFEGERFAGMEYGGKRISRVNMVGNIVDKYSNPEKRYSSLTLDDGSGQLRLKGFSDQFELLSGPAIGDTVYIIGMLKHFNDEIYVMPEIIKISDPRWLGIRRLELKEAFDFLNQPKGNAVMPQQPEMKKDEMESFVTEQTIFKQEKVISEQKPNYGDGDSAVMVVQPQPQSSQQPAQSSQQKEAFQTSLAPPPQIDSPKLKALSIIKKEGEIQMDMLIILGGMTKDELSPIIKDLITEGEIYESRPGYLCSLN